MAMFDIIEKTLTTALGAASLTQKKAEELAVELKQRFDLSEEQGKELIAKIKQSAVDSSSKLGDQASEETRKACAKIGLVTRDEFDALNERVAALEKQLGDTGEQQ